jgi:sulfide:quinone oxidoreductase
VAPRVLIAGGGVTGVEALLAISDLAGDRVDLALVTPEPDFLYKPLLVEEPFGAAPAERHELAPLASERGARLVRGSLAGVRVDDHVAELDDGSELPYEQLLVCVGGRFRPAFENVITFPGPEALEIESLVLRAAGSRSPQILFIVPPGAGWPLPAYELALMTDRRARQQGEKVQITLASPEPGPLAVFGQPASQAVAALLAGRGISFEGDAFTREVGEGFAVVAPGDRRLDAGVIVSLPHMDGPRISGLPADEAGFIPIDEHARVRGASDVFAAGDGTDFPLKQGGIGTQQADAAAEQIAALAGAELTPSPFRPVLRGMLLTGDESLSMTQDIGGTGHGDVSSDMLWWPPQKIGGRYLSAWLGHEEPGDVEPPRPPIGVEVELPQEWHGQPMVPGLEEPPAD